jgi:hypothetical protein
MGRVQDIGKTWEMPVVEVYGGDLLLGASLLVFSSPPAGVRMGEYIASFFQLILLILSVYSDDCRFPHVMPDGPGPNHQGHFGGRGGGPRPRGGQPSGHAFRVIEEKFAAMAIQEVNFSFIRQ